MKVKIIKNYKFLKTGSIINVDDGKATALIKKGFAKEEPELKKWRIGDLYVAESVVPQILMGKIIGVEPKSAKIFAYCFHKDELLGYSHYGYDVYKHALTETRYITANRHHSMYNKNDHDLNLYINEYNKCTSKFGSVFSSIMLERGWTENTYLSREELAECEKMLNKENKSDKTVVSKQKEEDLTK